MSQNISDPDSEIVMIQMRSMLKQLNTERPPLLVRAMVRFHEEFLGSSIKNKCRFVQHVLAWGYKKLTNKVSLLLSGRRRNVNNPGDALTAAIHLTGGLGDVLIASTFVHGVARQLPKATFDIFAVAPEHAKFVFAKAASVRNVVPLRFAGELEGNYDLVIRVNEYVKYDVKNYSKILTIQPEFLNTLNGAEGRVARYEVFYRKHPELNGLYGRLSTLENRNRLDALGYLGNLDVGRNTEYQLYPDIGHLGRADNILGGPNAKYITIHDGFDTTNKHVIGSATKCWPMQHWTRFVHLFNEQFPDVKVVQLGGTTSRRIPGVDLDLVSRTSLHEAAWILKHSLLHVDGESGLVHVARALHTKSIVLFGPTSKDFFAYERNSNLVSAACSNCWWSTTDWLARCPRGLSEPECMKSIMPENVVAEARGALASRDRFAYGLDAVELYQSHYTQKRMSPLKDGALLSSDAAEDPELDVQNSAQSVAENYPDRRQYAFVDRVVENARKSGQLTIAAFGPSCDSMAVFLTEKGHSVTVMGNRSAACQRPGNLSVGMSEERPQQSGDARDWSILFNVPYEDNSFDIVTCLSVLEDVPYRAYFLREALRILKLGGLFIFTFQSAPFTDIVETSVGRKTVESGHFAGQIRDLLDSFPGLALDEIEATLRRIGEDQAGRFPDGITELGLSYRKELL